MNNASMCEPSNSMKPIVSPAASIASHKGAVGRNRDSSRSMESRSFSSRKSCVASTAPRQICITRGPSLTSDFLITNIALFYPEHDTSTSGVVSLLQKPHWHRQQGCDASQKPDTSKCLKNGALRGSINPSRRGLHPQKVAGFRGRLMALRALNDAGRPWLQAGSAFC